MPARAARKPHTPAESSPLLNPGRLKHLYSTMLQCRMLSERAKDFPAQEAFTSGQEAALVGCGVNLQAHDYVVSSHPAAALARGTPIELVVVQSYIPQSAALGAGVGLAVVYRKQSRPAITLAFAEGRPWQEAVSYAAKNRLPVVFVVSGSVSGKNGIPVIDVDANDVVAVYRVSQEAIRRAREGHGPTLIVSNVAPGSARDPLDFMEQYLRTRRLWSDAWKQKLVKDFNHQLNFVISSFSRTIRL